MLSRKSLSLSPKSRVSVESSFEKSGRPLTFASGREDLALSPSESFDSTLNFRAASLSRLGRSSSGSLSDLFGVCSKIFLDSTCLFDSVRSAFEESSESTDLFKSNDLFNGC